MSDDEQIGQNEIEKLLAQSGTGDLPAANNPPAENSDNNAALDQNAIEALMGGGAAPQTTSPTTPATASTNPETTNPVTGQNDIELLLNQAEAAIASIDVPEESLPPGVKAFSFADFSGTPASTETATLELMRDVQLDLKIELGRTYMHFEDVLKLQQGAVVPLDKMAGDPVDIYVNDRLIARGEVLVLNDNFCVRVAELIVGENACA